MPWINLATLLSILHRNRIDPRRIDVYVDAESIEPRPRIPQRELFELDRDTRYDDDQDDEEDEY